MFDTHTFCFSRAQRLLTPQDYRPVFESPQVHVRHTIFKVLARQNAWSHSRLGVVISKKHVRKAVHRNRMRRQVRETFRLSQQKLIGMDIVVLVQGVELIKPLKLEQMWQELVRLSKKYLAASSV